MSRRTALVANLVAAERILGGSHVTHQEREKHLRVFARVLHLLGFVNLTDVRDITEKHIRAYVANRLEEGIGKRTLQNHMAAIRSVLTAAGKENFARSARISNQVLGIDGASRAGTKAAMPEELYQSVLLRLRDEGLRAGIPLCRHFGLRMEEMIRCIRSLKTWETRLAQGLNIVTIIYGTKGGRPRDARVVDVAGALAAVREAIALVELQGGKLIDRPNLKKAADTVTSKTTTAGMGGLYTMHSLRYNYAQDLKKAFAAEGYSEDEVKAMVSLSLGHGDGRGKYVDRVYAPEPELSLPCLGSVP